MQILWCALVDLPGLPLLLGFPENLCWRQGGHGEGDVTGSDAASVPARVRAHLEGKSAAAKESYGSRCRQGCGRYLSQFGHMAHDPEAHIVIVTHSWRQPIIEKMAADAAGPGRVRVISFAELADLVEAALVNAKPTGSLLAALLDAEAA